MKVIATVRVIDKIKKEKEVHYYVKSYESIKTEKAFAPTYGDLIEFYDVGGTNSYVVYINQEGCRVIRVNIQ